MKKSNLIFLVVLISGFLMVTGGAHANTIGPKPLTNTDIAKGTLFVKPQGTGTTCSNTLPCDIWTAVNIAKGGDVVFLREGTYTLSNNLNFRNQGSVAAPVIFESYPGESAVFDGSQHPKGTDIGILVSGKFIQLHRIEVKNMPVQGIVIIGTDNVLDGVHVHHSNLSGIQIHYSYDFPYGAYGSRNIIRNCTVNDNSGAGNFDETSKNGENSDGIAISNGTDNRVENCLVYNNSDDGIDTWRSTNTYVGYSISHSNGIADGEGNGIKAGGPFPGADTIVEHNLLYSNKNVGISSNSGTNVNIFNNTTWNNLAGYQLDNDAAVTNNIASETTQKWGNGVEIDNSWQRSGSVAFTSTDPKSTNFLVPKSDGGSDDIGAFVNVTAVKNDTPLPDVIVTQLSYANGIFTSTVKNQGSAAVPAGKTIGVGYLVNNRHKTWGDVLGPLAAGASVTISTEGGSYIIPSGTHTMTAYVDDADRFAELNETNNQLSRSVTVP